MTTMPAGIRKIGSPGRLEGHGRHIAKTIRFEVRVYNPRSKQTEDVGRYSNIMGAMAAMIDVAQAHVNHGVTQATDGALGDRPRTAAC